MDNLVDPHKTINGHNCYHIIIGLNLDCLSLPFTSTLAQYLQARLGAMSCNIREQTYSYFIAQLKYVSILFNGGNNHIE
jgi:hypothetical protein